MDIKSYINHVSPRRIFAILFLLGILVYANAIFHPFVHDDIVFIKENPHIADFDLKKIFLNTASPDKEISIINTYYRPLLEFFYRLPYQFAGLNPYMYHFFNIVIHICNSYLLFLCTNLVLKKKQMYAFIVSVLFLIHPVQTEAVACISGISNLIYVFFCLASFYYYLLYRQINSRSWWLYVMSLITFILALLSKEQSIVLPILIVGYEWCFYYKENAYNKTESIVKVLPFFIISMLYFVFRRFFLGISLGGLVPINNELWLRLYSIPGTLLTYFRLIVWPADLHYYRTYNILEPQLAQIIVFTLLIMLCVCFISRQSVFKRSILIFGAGLVFDYIATDT